MYLRKPAKKDIYSGNTVDILNREGIRQGRAELIRRSPSKFIQDNLPYARPDNPRYVWSYERWVVSWQSHPRFRKGDISTVEVNYFLKQGHDVPSRYDQELPKTDTVRLLFIELEGTLILQGKEVCCVSDFHKVWRSYKKPDIVILSHNPTQARELFDLHEIKARIAGFIDPKEMTFEQGILQHLHTHAWDDYLILIGESSEKAFKSAELLNRTLRSNPSIGIQWQK